MTFQLSKFNGAIELLSGNILIVTPCRVGHESGPSMGRVGLCRFGSGWVMSVWVGLGHKILVLRGSGWVGSSAKNI